MALKAPSVTSQVRSPTGRIFNHRSNHQMVIELALELALLAPWVVELALLAAGEELAPAA